MKNVQNNYIFPLSILILTMKVGAALTKQNSKLYNEDKTCR